MLALQRMPPKQGSQPVNIPKPIPGQPMYTPFMQGKK